MSQPRDLFLCGDVVLPDRIVKQGAVLVSSGRIAAVGQRDELNARAAALGCESIQHDGYLSPGWIDLHVHGATRGAVLVFVNVAPGEFERLGRFVAALLDEPA